MGIFNRRKKESNFVEVSSHGLDPTKLPYGFFIVQTSEKQRLGYNDPPKRIPAVDREGLPVYDKDGQPVMREVESVFGYTLNCGETIVVGGKRITLDVPRDQLPVVKLQIVQQRPGVHQVGNQTVIDTAALDSFDGEFEWGGDERYSTDARRRAEELGDPGLWGPGFGSQFPGR